VSHAGDASFGREPILAVKKSRGGNAEHSEHIVFRFWPSLHILAVKIEEILALKYHPKNSRPKVKIG
jgi:hypothetical protein